jgi:hypothetical protein
VDDVRTSQETYGPPGPATGTALLFLSLFAFGGVDLNVRSTKLNASSRVTYYSVNFCDDLVKKKKVACHYIQVSHNLKPCIKMTRYLIRYEATCMECSVTFYRKSRDTSVSQQTADTTQRHQIIIIIIKVTSYRGTYYNIAETCCLTCAQSSVCASQSKVLHITHTRRAHFVTNLFFFI